MKRLLFVLVFSALVSVGFNSCSNSTSSPTDTTPSIDKIQPAHAAVGVAVTIVGKNFGASRGGSYVQFNGTQPADNDYSAWSATTITVAVPKGATTGAVKIFVNGTESNSVQFTVDTNAVNTNPVISSLDSSTASIGSIITVRGKNFGANKGTSSLTFNGVYGQNFPNWSDSSIKVAVPPNATSGLIIVTVGGVASNGINFTVRGTAPAGDAKIDSISPASSNMGSKITIYGSNFGATQGSSYIQFGGNINANYYQSWSGTKIVVEVPQNAQTGKVYVVVAGKFSNGYDFTVSTQQQTPTITYLDVTSGQAGQTIGIIGTNFGSAQGSNYVEFNGAKAVTYTSWTNTKITVNVPDDATTGNVYVWVNSTKSNGVAFKVQQKNYIVPDVLIPAGSFSMGSDGGDATDNKPVHSVKISKAYFMSLTEITQKQWKTVMNSSNPSKVVNDDNPVEQVTFLRAIDFCNRLSDLEGKTKCYTVNGEDVTCDFSANGYRLPTEAEWEYAARAGKTGDYSSSDIQNLGWVSENSGGNMHTVKGKSANAFGLYDMFGNAMEMCWDYYDAEYYGSSPSTDPTGPSSGFGERVARGGSYQNGADACSPVLRYSYPSTNDNYNYNLSFRVVRVKN